MRTKRCISRPRTSIICLSSIAVTFLIETSEAVQKIIKKLDMKLSWIKWWLVGGVAVVAILVSLVQVPLWSTLREVDINTGKVRVTRYVLNFQNEQHVEDSAISRAIPESLRSTAPPHWRPVTQFGMFSRVSPHFYFHGALNDVSTLMTTWEYFELPQDIRTQTAMNVLAIWQQSESDDDASQYIDELFASLFDGEIAKEQILATIRTLKMPLVVVDGTTQWRAVFYANGQMMDRQEGYTDASGAFVRHGVWEHWWLDGRRSLYGHFENDQHHGRRFEWDDQGRLTSMSSYEHGESTAMASSNFDQQPDYEMAVRLGGEVGNPPSPVRGMGDGQSTQPASRP